MGIDTLCTTDTHMMFINGSIMSAADAVVILSNSGSSYEVNDAAMLGKKNGARLIGITAFSESPLAKMVDYPVIVKSADLVANTRFVNSQFASIYVIDILTTMLLENDTFHQRLEGTVKLITDHRSQITNYNTSKHPSSRVPIEYYLGKTRTCGHQIVARYELECFFTGFYVATIDGWIVAVRPKTLRLAYALNLP